MILFMHCTAMSKLIQTTNKSTLLKRFGCSNQKFEYNHQNIQTYQIFGYYNQNCTTKLLQLKFLCCLKPTFVLDRTSTANDLLSETKVTSALPGLCSASKLLDRVSTVLAGSSTVYIDRQR